MLLVSLVFDKAEKYPTNGKTCGSLTSDDLQKRITNSYLESVKLFGEC